MILYFVKSTFLLLVFFSIYRFSLQDKKSLQFNRFYLLIALVLGLILPLFNFSFFVESNPISETKEVVFQQIEGFSDFEYFPMIQKESLFSNFEFLFIGIVIFLTIRFVFRVYLIIRLKSSGQQIKNEYGKLILHSKIKSPFSFLKSIYLNLESWNAGLIEKEILIHEQGHITQKHSLDILFIEFLKIGLWFQPMLYFYKKAIQENHEFLADAYCLQQTTNINAYQNIILNYYSEQNKRLELSSSFDYNNLKKRFMMMKNTKKGNVTKVLFYSSAFVLTYFGLVGIETKANSIEKLESQISDKVNLLIDAKISNSILVTDKKSDNDLWQIEFNEKHLENENRRATPKVDFTIFLNQIQDKVEDYYLNESLLSTVQVFFNISESGKICDVQVVNTDDLEIINYIKMILVESPNWNPEINNGVPIKSKISIPLRVKETLLNSENNIDSEVSKVTISGNDIIKASPKEGIKSFYQSFMEQVNVPNYEKDSEIKVVVKMVVDVEGNLTNFKIVNKSDANEPFEIEFLRVLKTMPKWNPATQEGKPIASDFYLPITLRNK